MPRVFIGIGSNINPEHNIISALKLLNQEEPVKAVSTFYRTEPIGKSDIPRFYNGVVEITTASSPVDLKEKQLKKIEQQLGRQQAADPYAPRTIDLDIICYDDLELNTRSLNIPDPDIAHRPFLAVPLAELAPDLVIPGQDKKARDLAAPFTNHTMEPLKNFTDAIRKEIS